MDARARILRAAREEFMVNGFRDASLRTIARESGVAVSNIYNYFEHKDSLFRAVLQPLLNEFGRIMEGHNSEHNMDVYMLMPEKFREETTKEFMQFARQFRAELKLLLLQSGGSSLEHFKDQVISRQIRSGENYLQLFKEKYPHANTEVSPFFIRLGAAWWVNVFIEIITNEIHTEEEINQGLSEYIAFGTAGWRALMQI